MLWDHGANWLISILPEIIRKPRFSDDFWGNRSSAVSRAILKPVYRFGIPNSNTQTLKSVDFWCKLSSTFPVAEPRERCLSYSERKIAKNFQGFATGPHWGGLTAPPQTPRLHNGFSPRYARWETGTPKKLLDTALRSELIRLNSINIWTRSLTLLKTITWDIF